MGDCDQGCGGSSFWFLVACCWFLDPIVYYFLNSQSSIANTLLRNLPANSIRQNANDSLSGFCIAEFGSLGFIEFIGFVRIIGFIELLGFDRIV